MAATCMAVCKGSHKKIRGIFISSCHLPAAVECDIVILSEPGPNPTGSSWAVLRTQLIPARGRKLWAQPQETPWASTQLIPARGRKPSNMAYMIWTARHNLSPRGDGNTLEYDSSYVTAATQLIPARGRKLRAEADLHGFHRTQLIPARGRKLGCWPRWSGSSPDTTYPREGTETADGARIQARTLDTTYPREGTETFASNDNT